ncbi:MAG: energy transducer TonB [Betaproteobacteria bacterium]|nr:energy transducer TonB [Betaproteobacteria bacterium]
MSGEHFDYQMPSPGRERLRNVALAGGAIALVALLGFAGWRLAKDVAAPKKKHVQEISLVKPPLPPKQEKPPEPEKKEEVKQEIKTPEPEKDDSPPPAQDLGLDAKGEAGGDAFGLQGRPGGRDITTIGPEGSGNGRSGNSAFYANQLQNELQDVLNRNDKLRAAEYRALVRLWMDASGRVTRVELAGSTGDGDLDRRLREALEEAKRLKPPPEGMAQPIRLELVSRRT